MRKPSTAEFDAISEKARKTIYDKVLQHYRKNPDSPWSGKALVELERTIRQFYADLGVEYKKEFRATLPATMQSFYDDAVQEIRKAGTYKAIIGKPDTKRIQYFLDSANLQVAMKTDKMCFDNVRDLRSLSADVFREISVTGATRREVSKKLLDRALKLKGFEFIDKSGTKWPLKSYFNTLARTELMNAGRASYDDKMAEEGFDVMKLTTSGNSCEKCAAFEGRLFSLTGATPGLPTKADLEAAGVFHPNCTHSYSLMPDFVRERDYNQDGTKKVDAEPDAPEEKEQKVAAAPSKSGRSSQYADVSGSPKQEKIISELEKTMKENQTVYDNMLAEDQEITDAIAANRKALKELDAKADMFIEKGDVAASQRIRLVQEGIVLQNDELRNMSIETARENLFLPQSARGVFPVGNVESGLTSKAEEASEFVGGMTSRKVLKGAKTDIVRLSKEEIENKERSYYFDKAIRLRPTDGVKTVVHEMCHHIEEINPHVRQKCKEFLDARCGTNPVELLSRITGDNRFGEDEFARRDRFFNVYCGKHYDDGSTEILSMGLEELYRNPLAFYRKDPEYFNFIVSVLRGQI